MGRNKAKDVGYRVLNGIRTAKQNMIKFVNEKNILSWFNMKKFPTKVKFNYKIVNSKRFIISFLVLSFIIFIVPYIAFVNKAYSVMINNIEVAKVKNKKTVEATIRALKEQFEKDNESAVVLNSNVSYKKVRAPKQELYEGKTLEEQLRKHITYSIKAFVIYANDNAIVCVRTKDEAEMTLSDMKNNFIKGIDSNSIKEIGFVEKVQIKEEFCEISSLTDWEEAKNLIINGTSQIKTHKVEYGESFWSISQKHGISMKDLQIANPDVNPEKINIGQEINLTIPKPLINVKMVEEVTYKEKIPFQQKSELNHNMHNNQTFIKVKGEYGEKEVQASITKINGVEIQKDIIKEKIIKSPKDQVIVKGTKK